MRASSMLPGALPIRLLPAPTTPLVPVLLKLKVMAPAPLASLAGLLHFGQTTA